MTIETKIVDAVKRGCWALARIAYALELKAQAEKHPTGPACGRCGSILCTGKIGNRCAVCDAAGEAVVPAPEPAGPCKPAEGGHWFGEGAKVCTCGRWTMTTSGIQRIAPTE